MVLVPPNTSLTDENSQPRTLTFADANYWRPTSAQDPTHATTNLSYFTSPIAAEGILNFNGTTSTSDTRITVDALGRVQVSQVKQSQTSSSYDSIETDYDSLGRTSRITVPYSGSAGQTNSGAPATTTSYDPLSRLQSVTDGGGGVTNYTYNQNDVLVELAPAPANENTNKRQLEYDGLGRLTSVCEISSAMGSGSCGQNTSATGFLTKYTYDVLNNLLTVTQNAQSGSTQTRTYAYDGLSRLTSEQNPETGGVAYNYTYDTDTTCGMSNGDLVKRVDPVGTTTCYAYDVLHRLTNITYSNGNAPKYYVYDAATVDAVAMVNAKGRLAEAYTNPASNKTTDLGFSYSARGEVTDTYQSSVNSGGYYHLNASYWPNGLLNTMTSLSSFPTLTQNPDGEGRPLSISDGSNQLVTNTLYNTFSEPTTVTFGGSGYNDTYGYDGNTGRMNSFRFPATTGTYSGTPT